MGLLRVGHDSATSLSLFTFMHWSGKWQPTPAFLPGESQGWQSLVGCIYGVAQSLTQLKQLSSNSSSSSSITTTNKKQNISPLLPPNSLKRPLFSQFLIPTSKQEVTDFFLFLQFCSSKNSYKWTHTVTF